MAKHFQGKRLDRKRIHNLQKGTYSADRFDLITLLFFVYSQEEEPDWPAERFLKFIDEINDILHRCRMMELYPANPYESFISMCLVSDEPLAVFNEIWEQAYSTEDPIY